MDRIQHTKPDGVAPAPRAAGALGLPWWRGLRFRVALWFGALAFAMLALTSGAAWLASSRLIERAAVDGLERATGEAAMQLDAALVSVQITADGVAALATTAHDRDDAVRVLRALVLADPSAAGGLLALEPGAFGEGSAPLGYYAAHPRTTATDRDFAATGYAWREQPWFAQTLAAPAGWWSEPYLNETAGGAWVSTWNRPIHDALGRPVGMTSLDVPVDELARVLAPLRAQPGLEVVLVAPGGTLALHPDPAVALRGSLDALVDAGGRIDLAPARDAHAAIEAVRFEHLGAHDGAERISRYAPVGATGWGVLATLQRDAVLAELRAARRWIGGSALALLLGTVLLINRLARRITDPVSALAEAARRLEQGDYAHPVAGASGRDEVGVLAHALEAARVSIQGQLAQIGDLGAQRQKLESELSIARDIQLAMLPPDAALDVGEAHLEVSALLEPAKAVGGDFYAFFRREDGLLWFAIGDVSDKGVPAALFMARTVAVLESAGRATPVPGMALARAARRLAAGNDTCMFATVLCGVLDPGSGMVELASAGHEPPVLLRGDGRVELLDVPPGGPLGIEEDVGFDGWAGMLGPGDTLLLYTDGVTEAFDRALRPFGLERLLAALDPARDAAAQCRGVVAAVHAFADGAEPSDDITVLALSIGRAPGGGGGDGDGDDAPLHARLSPEGGRAGLAALADALDGLLLARRLPRTVLDDARLVVEEVLANVYDHGGRDGAPPWSELEVAQRGDLLWLHLRDDGPPWDPLQAPAPDLDAEIDDRPVGGLGIHLVREFAAEIHYAREGALNHLAVALRLPPADAR